MTDHLGIDLSAHPDRTDLLSWRPGRDARVIDIPSPVRELREFGGRVFAITDDGPFEIIGHKAVKVEP